MSGTQHFSRMNYHVRRGLREIVAPSHKIGKAHWAAIPEEFNHACAYCGVRGSAENRGIVADHLIAVTEYGELVAGNTVPACQSCNDSRGKVVPQFGCYGSATRRRCRRALSALV